MATFPGAIWAPTTKVDGVDDVQAAHVNDLQNEVVALETSARQAINNLLYDTLTNDASWLSGTTFADAANDSYLGALWNSLWSLNAPDWSRQAGGASDPFEYYLRCTFDNTSQAGIVQFLEAKDTIPLRGKTLSLSADLWGTGVTSTRMAVLEWAGTADAVTSDVVGAWGTGNPTLAANWTYIGTPAALTVSATRARLAVNNLTVGASTNNLAVFIWTDAAEANTDLFNVARVKLEPSAAATDFVAMPFKAAQEGIQRYYIKFDVPSGTYAVGVGAAFSTTDCRLSISLPTTMRTTPTINTGGASLRGNGGSVAVTSFSSAAMRQLALTTIANTASGLTSGEVYVLTLGASYLELDTRL